MTKPILALCLSALAVFGWTLPVAHSAPPPASRAAAEPVALEIDVDALPENEHAVAPLILRELGELLEGGGVQIVDDPEGATVLRIRLRQMEAGDRNYGLHFEFVDGDAVEPAIEWTDCVFCTEARVVQKLEAVAPELIAAIEARQQGEVVEVVDTGDGGEDDGETDGGGESDGGEDDGGVEPPPAPIGPLGFAGIGVAAVGLGVTIAGAVELSRGVVRETGTRELLDVVDHRPRGAALLGVGLGSVAVGAILLGVDLGLRAKKRKQASSQHATIVPLVAPGSAGIGVVGKF